MAKMKKAFMPKWMRKRKKKLSDKRRFRRRLQAKLAKHK